MEKWNCIFTNGQRKRNKKKSQIEYSEFERFDFIDDGWNECMKAKNARSWILYAKKIHKKVNGFNEQLPFFGLRFFFSIFNKNFQFNYIKYVLEHLNGYLNTKLRIKNKKKSK